MASGMKRSESQLSLIDGELKNATVKELAKAGITIEGLRDDMAPEEREKLIRTHRRKLANRESAKRSKIRKKAEDAKLLDTTKTLLADAKSMRQTIQDLQRKVDVLHAENVKLRRRLGENVEKDGETMSPEIAHMPINVPPEVETPSAVIKDTRKKLKRSMPSESDLPKKMAPKRKGMLKSNSDSSIATNFGDKPQYAIAGAPDTAEAAETYTRAFKQGAVGGSAPQEDAYADFCVDKFLNLMGSNNRADSPFFTDNLMYGCQDGELVHNTEDCWAL
jgi:regulator of replication initiation timing